MPTMRSSHGAVGRPAATPGAPLSSRAGLGLGLPTDTPSARANAPLPFQTEFIKNLIEDSLADFRFGIHRDIHNMHIELLRQFEMHKVFLWAWLLTRHLRHGAPNQI